MFVSCAAYSSSVEMPEKGWKSKGDKEPRRNPRKRGKTCGRPFKAPRPVSDAVERDSDVVLLTTDTDSQVQVITETENERDLRGRRRTVMLSEREANEMSKYGEVMINYSSSDDGKEVRQDTPQQTTLESDATGSTPDIFKSLVLRLFRQSQQTQTQYLIIQFRQDLSQSFITRVSHMFLRQSNKKSQVIVRMTFQLQLC